MSGRIPVISSRKNAHAQSCMVNTLTPALLVFYSHCDRPGLQQFPGEIESSV